MNQKSDKPLVGLTKKKYTAEQWCWCVNYEKRTGFDPMMCDFEAGLLSWYESAQRAIHWFEDHASDALLSISANVPGDTNT